MYLASNRSFNEVRVAEQQVAVGVRASHRLGEQVNLISAAPRLVRDVERVGRDQELLQDDAARARRRHRDDVVAAVLELHRLAPLGLVLLEMGGHPECPRLLHLARHLVGERALVEAARILRDDLERRRQVRLHELVARGERRPVGLRERLGRDVEAEAFVFSHPTGDVLGLNRVELEAVLGQRDGGGDDVLPGQLTEAFVRRRDPPRSPGRPPLLGRSSSPSSGSWTRRGTCPETRPRGAASR